MWWMTTSFRVIGWSSEVEQALVGWRQHIRERHPKIQEVRCFRFDGGTSLVWQEGFRDFRDWQDLEDEEDELCESVMGAVFAHSVPGTRVTQFWRDALPATSG
jgi:hypothetical protein